MAKFLVTYHGSEMSHDPEAMAKAREAFLAWAAKTGDALARSRLPGRVHEHDRRRRAGDWSRGRATQRLVCR
jgi:hypothetical protein